LEENAHAASGTLGENGEGQCLDSRKTIGGGKGSTKEIDKRTSCDIPAGMRVVV